MKKLLITLKVFLDSCFFLMLIQYVSNSSIEEVRECLKQVIYSYYMRGPNIQYHASKHFYFPPEEATRQNINYLSCTPFTGSLYQEVLNITIPLSNDDILSYAREGIGKRPEVVAYANINSDNNIEMKVYSPTKNYTTIINPKLDEIAPLMQIGDVLYQTGHALTVNDIIKDKNGKTIDAILIDSALGLGRSIVRSKIPKQTITTKKGDPFVSQIHRLFLNSKLNTDLEEGLVEGSLRAHKLSKYTAWADMTNLNYRHNEYVIFRYVQKDSKGNAILKYIQKVYPYYKNNFTDGDIIKLSLKNLDRIKYKHLYIEKIVNKNNNNIVELGDYLTYKIFIKNNGKEDYKNDLIVIENLSNFVTFQLNYQNKEVLNFEKDLKNRKLKWNIGKLKSGEEFIISYIVRVTSGKSKDIILSTGFVGNIESSTVKNVIGINLNKNQMNSIIKNYEKLKGEYNGKTLINEIYKKSFDVDMKLDKFDITNLIIDTMPDSILARTIYLNENNTFKDFILNKYWSVLATTKNRYIQGGKEVDIFNVKRYQYFLGLEGERRREDFIYKEHFKTGDILIYKNHNDNKCHVENNILINETVTYENGEYAYIYIEGRGFVGVNFGKDGIPNTKDDRNEFNVKYYKDNNLSVCELCNNLSDEYQEIANLNSLFGKDYYVILRPSLYFDFPNNDYNIALIIIFVILGIIILVCGLFILWKCIKMKKSGKELNYSNFKKELLLN